MADVGARYAQALFELADEAGALSAVEADMKALKAMIAESTDLRRLISSPAFSTEDKTKALTAIGAEAQLHDLSRNFLGLIAANGRAAALSEVVAQFERLAADRRGAMAAEITTAVKLSVAQQKAVAAAIRQAFGKDPELSTRIDPSILGGIKVRVGSKLFDASLKSRLDQLKFALKRA